MAETLEGNPHLEQILFKSDIWHDDSKGYLSFPTIIAESRGAQRPGGGSKHAQEAAGVPAGGGRQVRGDQAGGGPHVHQAQGGRGHGRAEGAAAEGETFNTTKNIW